MSALIAAIDAALAEHGTSGLGCNNIGIHAHGNVYAHPGYDNARFERGRIMGKGKTVAEALADLQVKLADYDARDQDRERARLALIAVGLDPSLVAS